MPVQANADGSLDLDSLVSSSDVELREWIERRLRGTDTDIPGGTSDNEERHLTIVIAYEQLEVEQRRRVRRAVLGLLNSVVETPNELPIASQSLLFRLVELVIRDSVDQPLAVRRIVEYLGRPASDEAKRRALQSLVGLNFQLSEGFWISQYRGPEFAATVLEGLGNESLRAAFHFLANAGYIPALEASLIILVPSWIERCGLQESRRAFYNIQEGLDARYQRLLNQLLDVCPKPPLQIFDHPARTYEPLYRLPHKITA